MLPQLTCLHPYGKHPCADTCRKSFIWAGWAKLDRWNGFWQNLWVCVSNKKRMYSSTTRCWRAAQDGTAVHLVLWYWGWGVKVETASWMWPSWRAALVNRENKNWAALEERQITWNDKPHCCSFWVTAWLRGYRISVQQKARLSQMLGASATARMSHAPSGSPRSLQINLTQAITFTTALPSSAQWPFLSAVKSNQETSRNDCKTFWSHRALLRRNTAFPQFLRCALNNHC